jgi:AcrR family transcriptional regulator
MRKEPPERKARRPRREWERQILDRALVTFGREGYGVSINRLIEDSGAPVGTFYRLFPDKDALFARLMDDLHPEYLKRVAAEVGDVEDPVERLRRTVRSLIIVGARDFKNVARLYFTDVRGRGPAVAVARRVEDGELALIRDPLEDGVAAGRLTCPYPALAAQGILGLARRTVEPYVTGRPPVPIAAAADQAAGLAVDGLRAR